MKQLILISLLSFTLFGLTKGQAFQEGDTLPDIVAMGLNGTETNLYSLQGKIVLVDFWAGWCAPCRKENSNILKNYLEYKDDSFKNGEGFTVFSVSLDNNKNLWESIIQKDSLIWPYHVIDTKGFKGPIAKKYAIKSIPQSYLIDGNGVVIAANLRGKDLEANLRRIKNKKYYLF